MTFGEARAEAVAALEDAEQWGYVEALREARTPAEIVMELQFALGPLEEYAQAFELAGRIRDLIGERVS